MAKLLLIAAGGAVGSALRYLVAGWGQKLFNGSFPAGTMIVNVVGCFLIGLLAVALADPVRVRPELRMALLVGVLGGFTTFSTFGYESFTLMGDRQFALAGMNIVASVTLGLAAVWIGARLGQRIFGVQ